MRSKRTFLLAALSLGLPAVVLAHHNAFSVYDMRNTVTITGKFDRLELVNPHARLFVEVMNENGETEQWVVDGPGILSLARHGWTEDMFGNGERLVVTGNPALSRENVMWLQKLVREDGTELLEPGAADAAAIDAERRSRRSAGE